MGLSRVLRRIALGAALLAGLPLAVAQAPHAAPATPAPAAPGAAASGAGGCTREPLPGVTLYLRGGMNSWAPVDEYAFRWICDAYVLNVDLRGRQEFKVADADWTPATNFGAGPGAVERLVPGGGNAARSFDGAHTLRLQLRDGAALLEVGPRSAPDPVVRRLPEALTRALRFDSRDPAHKRPFGAVPAGTRVDFAVQAPADVEGLVLVVERRVLEGNQDRLDYVEPRRLPMRAAAARGGLRRWTVQHRFDAVGVFGYRFEARWRGERVLVHNNRDTVHWTRERGSGGRASVEPMPDDPRRIRRLRQTVHDPALAVPAWAQDAIHYQIFPDRFRNGDPSNDPQPGRDRYQRGTVERHARWLEPPFRPGSGDGSDALYNNDFFGGDLAGIIEKLDELAALGVDTLYLTPIFQAASNHKYDTADYRRIDPAFGTEADFERLTREAARRGLRILPDTSFNHVGSDSPYFNRFGNFPGLGAFQGGRPEPASPYASWFRFDPAATDPDRQYRHWGGPDLPEIDKGSSDFRDFAYRAPDSVTRRWLQRGAAGWRMDVAPWVPDDFWREWRQAVRQTRPDALTMAETWFDASKYLLGDMFDATMNYVFRNAVLDYAGGGRADALVAQLEHLREAYPAPAWRASMNLVSSHDVARAAHVLGWTDGPPEAEAARRAKDRYRLAVFLQMTQPGAPMVYYGDEVGMTGGEDPYNRGTYPWPDLGGRPDLALREQVRSLIALRRGHAILRRGEAQALRALDEHVVLSVRTLGARTAWVLSNNDERPRTVTLRDPLLARRPAWRDALDGQVLQARDGALRVVVPPLSGRVLLASPGGGPVPRDNPGR